MIKSVLEDHNLRRLNMETAMDVESNRVEYKSFLNEKLGRSNYRSIFKFTPNFFTVSFPLNGGFTESEL